MLCYDCNDDDDQGAGSSKTGLYIFFLTCKKIPTLVLLSILDETIYATYNVYSCKWKQKKLTSNNNISNQKNWLFVDVGLTDWKTA